MEKYILVTTLCKDKKVAENICDTLLGKHLVAGCQVSKVDSKYWWNGNLQLSHEYRLEFRSVYRLFDYIVDEIKELHDYEIPEISCVEIMDANDDFLEWISQYSLDSYEGEDGDESEDEEEQDSEFGLL
jgi:periplasmic divalent cation tolerance protein